MAGKIRADIGEFAQEASGCEPMSLQLVKANRADVSAAQKRPQAREKCGFAVASLPVSAIAFWIEVSGVIVQAAICPRISWVSLGKVSRANSNQTAASAAGSYRTGSWTAVK